MGRRMKREQTIEEMIAPPIDDRTIDAFPLNGLHCAECFELQHETPHGASCKNGHGGAPGIGPQEVEKRKASAVKETSAQLADQLGAEEREHAQARIRFASANAAKKKPMKAEIVRIADTMIVRDVEPAYKKIVEWLALGELRSDAGHVRRQLDEAQMMARNAFLLWVTVKNAREAWEKSNDLYFAPMKLEAHRELQAEKDNKRRNKQITDADVAMMCATIFGDQWVSDEIERAKYVDFEATLKDLAERCRERAYDLRSMLSSLK